MRTGQRVWLEVPDSGQSGSSGGALDFTGVVDIARPWAIRVGT